MFEHCIVLKLYMMEKFDIDISLKNIGSVSWKTYENMMINSIEDLIHRMRWRLYHFKKDKRRKNCNIQDICDNQFQSNDVFSGDRQDNSQHDFYGLRTDKQSPSDPDLKPFEKDMVNIISNLKQRKYHSDFQTVIKQIEKKLCETDKLLLESDKTDNFYLIEKDSYLKRLRDSITKDYRKASFDEIEEADLQAARLARQLGIEWRLEKTALKAAFLKAKDHKEDWPLRMSFRLINPMKNNIGKVSKIILERTNKDLRNILQLNQLISTQQVIDWYVRTENKEAKSFFQCDIESFYPSISQELLLKACEWARSKVFISDTAIDIIICARRNVLFDGENIWVKKKNSRFDIGMGAFDGAECSELIGLFMLHRLTLEEKFF